MNTELRQEIICKLVKIIKDLPRKQILFSQRNIDRKQCFLVCPGPDHGDLKLSGPNIQVYRTYPRWRTVF